MDPQVSEVPMQGGFENAAPSFTSDADVTETFEPGDSTMKPTALEEIHQDEVGQFGQAFVPKHTGPARSHGFVSAPRRARARTPAGTAAAAVASSQEWDATHDSDNTDHVQHGVRSVSPPANTHAADATDDGQWSLSHLSDSDDDERYRVQAGRLTHARGPVHAPVHTTARVAGSAPRRRVAAPRLRHAARQPAAAQPAHAWHMEAHTAEAPQLALTRGMSTTNYVGALNEWLQKMESPRDIQDVVVDCGFVSTGDGCSPGWRQAGRLVLTSGRVLEVSATRRTKKAAKAAVCQQLVQALESGDKGAAVCAGPDDDLPAPCDGKEALAPTPSMPPQHALAVRRQHVPNATAAMNLWAQEQGLRLTDLFGEEWSEGPPHALTWYITMTALLPDGTQVECIGQGRSLKSAKEHACQQMLRRLPTRQ